MKTKTSPRSRTRSALKKRQVRRTKLNRLPGAGPLARKREMLLNETAPTGVRNYNRSATSSVP